jgi:hypothetical protein
VYKIRLEHWVAVGEKIELPTLKPSSSSPIPTITEPPHGCAQGTCYHTEEVTSKKKICGMQITINVWNTKEKYVLKTDPKRKMNFKIK